MTNIIATRASPFNSAVQKSGRAAEPQSHGAAENSGQKTEDSGQRSEDSGQKSEDTEAAETAALQAPPLLPARMLNEFTYCPRLAWIEWVQGEFAHSSDTLDGALQHRRVDKPVGYLPPPDAEAAPKRRRSKPQRAEPADGWRKRVEKTSVPLLLNRYNTEKLPAAPFRSDDGER